VLSIFEPFPFLLYDIFMSMKLSPIIKGRIWLWSWLTIVTLLCLGVYLAGQQILRQSANLPQIELARSVKNALESGAPWPTQEKNRIDIASSDQLFYVVYSPQGIPQAGSGELEGKLPTLPVGIFKYVLQKGEDRVTWQPRKKLREAAVIMPLQDGGGFVLASRSLAMTEDLTAKLGRSVFIGWLMLVAVTLALFFMANQPYHKRR
jgi:hypothetical protein